MIKHPAESPEPPDGIQKGAEITADPTWILVRNPFYLPVFWGAGQIQVKIGEMHISGKFLLTIIFPHAKHHVIT
jgi:hypothetical protein